MGFIVVENFRAYLYPCIVGTLFILPSSLVVAMERVNGLPGDLASSNHEGEMPLSRVGISWPTADRDLKLRFEQEYLSATDPRPVFRRYLDTLGAEVMLDYLEFRNARCHGEAHDLGEAIFEQAKDIGLALQICGNRCTNACMHGVVSAAFGNGGYDEVIQQMARFCNGEEMASLHKPGNCAHGMGHALMMVTGHDIGRSLVSCSAFPKTGMDYYCATGVFMEYWGNLEDSEELGAPISRPSLHFPCDTYTRFPAACYRYMVRRIAYELNADQERVIEECLGLDEIRRKGCFHGLGAMYSRTVAAHPSLLSGLCLRGSPEDQILCIEGVIEKMADFDEKQAMVVCSTLKGAHAKVCTAAAREKMYRLNKPTMKLYRGVGSIQE